MIVYLTGEDTFRLRQRRRALVKAARQKYPASQITRIDGLWPDEVAAALERATAPSLFQATNIIEVVSAELAAAPILEFLKQRFKRLEGPETILIIASTVDDTEASQALDKFLKKHSARAEQIPALSAAQLGQWLARYATEQNLKIDPAALNYLAQASVGAELPSGDRTWRAVQNLERCAAYATPQAVTLEIARALVAPPPESRIFVLLDALGARSVSRALSAIAQEYAAGSNDFMILAMFQYQLRLLAQARLALDAKEPGTLSKIAKLKPFVAQKALAAAARFNRPELEKLYNELSQTHLALRRSPLPARTLMERFVIKFAAGV